VLCNQHTVKGGVIDNKIAQNPEAKRLGYREHLSELHLGITGGGVNKPGINGRVVLDRVETARITRQVDRIDKDPVKSQGANSFQVGLPPRQWTCEQWKEIINTRAR
jgi:hypothetical protein